MNKTNVFLGVVGLIGLLILGYSVWGIMNQVAGNVKTTEYGITYYANGKSECPRVTNIQEGYEVEAINYNYPEMNWVIWVSYIDGIHRKYVPFSVDTQTKFMTVEMVGCDMKVDQTQLKSHDDEYEDLIYVTD